MSVFIGYPSFMAYQMMKGKKGNNDGFPSISGIIARYSALGLTNEQMAANPVWVDKTGNGHDLQMKNFGWAGMSGVNGYAQNFNKFYNNAPSFVTIITKNDHLVDFTVRSGVINALTMLANNYNKDKTYFVKVTSEGYGDGDLSLSYTIDSVLHKITLNPNGYTKIPVIEGTFSYFNLNVSGKEGYITIEQLSLYPGALVFDGVDDYGTCDNFPVLTKEKGYTVVVLRSYLAESIGYLVYNGTNAKQSAFVFERSDSFDTWSWGKNSSIRNLVPKLMSYQTSNSYNNNIISTGTAIEGDKLIRIAYGYNSNVAIWELVFLDHDATEEELTKIKDYFVKTYPWLFFDQAWTVTGKTNEDKDRATIANITGNGNNLVLSNFGFAENSGYGLYYQYFGNGFKTTNGEIIGGSWNKINNYNISCNIRMPINSIGNCFWDSSVLTTGIKLRFKLTGMAEGDVLAFGYTNVYDLTYTSDGIYIIELPPTDKSCGFSLQSSLTENLPTTQVTIELLPFDYEGYLVTDGVDDGITSLAFTMNKDFTVVGEWKMLKNSDTYELAGINKHGSFILYNYSYNNRINMYIHSGQGTPINTDSIKAFTSTGLIYIDDFNNVEEVIPRDETDRGYLLFIGYNNNVFTKLAFKNLAIYPTILSKEDCIKAYNYLQTLKAK